MSPNSARKLFLRVAQPYIMDIREICAEKIRGMNDTIRYRDFFDFYLIREQIKPDLPEILDW